MRSRWLLLATGGYGLAIALIGLWSRPVDRDVPVSDLAPVQWLGDALALDAAQTYQLAELAANVVLFVPLGVLTLLWRPRWGWTRATLVALCVSGFIELLQCVLRPERFASITDVVANTVGGALGGLLVVGVRAFRR